MLLVNIRPRYSLARFYATLLVPLFTELFTIFPMLWSLRWLPMGYRDETKRNDRSLS